MKVQPKYNCQYSAGGLILNELKWVRDCNLLHNLWEKGGVVLSWDQWTILSYLLVSLFLTIN